MNVKYFAACMLTGLLPGTGPQRGDARDQAAEEKRAGRFEGSDGHGLVSGGRSWGLHRTYTSYRTYTTDREDFNQGPYSLKRAFRTAFR